MEQKWETVVIGGGLSGTFAAIASAREGRRTLLVEKYGFLGGTAVSGLVNPFMHYHKPGLPVNNAGLFQALLDRLEAMGALHENRHTFNEQLLTIALENMAQDAGVRVLLHGQLVCAESAPARDGSRVDRVGIQGLAGKQYKISSDIFVDATGDGDLMTFAGSETKLGADADHSCQPMTMCSRIGGVDMERLERAMRDGGFGDIKAYLDDAFRRAKAAGELDIPREDVLCKPTMMRGVLHFNTTRVSGKSSLDSESFTEAEREGRRQSYALYRFLVHRVKGFEHSVLLMLAPQIGVRESRRFVGKYVLTGEDVMRCRKFDSSIARGCYGVDIHDPNGQGTVRQIIEGNDYHGIPLECLYSDYFSNLIVTGRPISSDHAAYSAIRIMPICACLGEAAGIFAALGGVKADVRRVDYHDVQAVLTARGGIY